MKNKRDYYEILGINKNATDKEIKSAFRQKARELHPDRNKAPDAEEKFKELNEAYEVLSTPDKKAIYDQYGHEGMQQGFGSGFGGFGNFGGFGSFEIDSFFDSFGDFFGGSSSRKKRKAKGEDVVAAITISFIDSILGKVIKQNLDKYEVCESCNGSGAQNPHDIVSCPTCNGQGFENVKIKTFLGNIVQKKECSTCEGKGTTNLKKCSSCNGKKIVKKSKEVKINIPEGIQSGQMIRIEGYGNLGYNGGPNGDLLLQVNVLEHKHFRRKENDIYLNLPLSITDLLSEASIQIPTPRGDETIKVKSSWETDDVITLKGKGTKNPYGSKYGDLKLIIKLYVPKLSTNNSRKILEVLENTKDTKYSSWKKDFN